MKNTISQYKTVIAYSIPIIISFILLYYQIFGKLMESWDVNPNYSHGYFIPFLAVFMIWMRRDEIFSTPASPAPVWGFLFLGFGLLQLMVAWIGSEYFLQASSMIPVLLGVSLFFWGKPITWKLAIPILYLIFMIPLPAIIWDQIAFPLSLLASRISADFISFLGMPILREGNILHLPNTVLQVEEACSGLRSLTTMFALSALVAYLSPLSRISKMVIFLAAVPIAFVGNIVRLIGTAILARYYGPSVAEGFIHDFSGWLMFVFGLIALMLLQSLLTRWESPAREEPAVIETEDEEVKKD